MRTGHLRKRSRPVEIYLIRHTTPAVGKGICYGQADIPLAESFDMELDFIRDNIPAFFDAIYMSPSQRCTRLGKKLKGRHHLLDKRLMEMNFGDWELKKWNEIDQDALNYWMADFVNRRVPQGESFAQVFGRVESFIEDLKREGLNEIAIVAHAGVIRCFIARFANLPLKSTFHISVGYGSIQRFIMQ